MTKAQVSRRDALRYLAAGAAATTGCSKAAKEKKPAAKVDDPSAGARTNPVLELISLGSQWQTDDPFLFCVHHDDRYPAGNDALGPATTLEGRNLGQDFEGHDGWRMYHGRTVPGFPRHPHRGFETVTVVRQGLLDHSDSLGATARYGRGDVQWLTAGRGIQHAEMFPLLRVDSPNPLELFQIWLNLPSDRKMVEPHFSMLWQPTIPVHVARDRKGRPTWVTVIAGRYAGARAPAPPPSSWAVDDANQVAIWTIRMAPHAQWQLPAATTHVNRSLYYFSGSTLQLAGRRIASGHQIRLAGLQDTNLENGPGESEMLLLQGRPIAEPIARHGPFVMNTQREIRQAYLDYHRTQFGGWPWQRHDPVHDRGADRFALRTDGRMERPG